MPQVASAPAAASTTTASANRAKRDMATGLDGMKRCQKTATRKAAAGSGRSGKRRKIQRDKEHEQKVRKKRRVARVSDGCPSGRVRAMIAALTLASAENQIVETHTRPKFVL